MASFESPVKLDPSNPKKKRENISWDKCIVCQRVSLEQRVNMLGRKPKNRNKSVIYKIPVKIGKYRIPKGSVCVLQTVENNNYLQQKLLK
jgi:hypothetical protein